MKTLTRALTMALLSMSLAAVGCDTGTREDPNKPKQGSTTAATTSSSAGGSTSASGGNSGALSATAPPTPALAVQRADQGNLVAVAFTLNAGPDDMVIKSIEVTASGTVDESVLGEAKWVEDLNGNGEVDPGEPVHAVAAQATQDDPTYNLRALPAVIIPANQSATYLLALDTGSMSQLDQVALVGKTVELSIPDASKIDAADNSGGVVTPGGTFPISGSTTIEFGAEHVLISEVVVSPGSGATSGEYVELINPTSQPIDLENYYLTDYSDNPTNGRYYFNLPTGVDFGPANTDTSSDFIVRFPKGAAIQPGQVITIAIDGEGFKATYSSEADYCIRNAGTTASEQMLTWDGPAGSVDFSATPASDNAGLTNGGEWICLFTWDGSSDLIQDVDILLYGTGTSGIINKTPNLGLPNIADIRVDSLFDQDNVASEFKDDQDETFQANNRAPGGPSITRVDFTEGNELKTGGNGITGNDETSENAGDGAGGNGTFERSQTATPGTLK